MDLTGWEQRGRNGYWYPVGQPTTNPRVIRVCEECDQEYMGLRFKYSRFCSKACVGRRLDASYHALHQRVYVAKGKASDQLCVDCGEQAADWSRTHDTSGHAPEHYQPRCKKCHRAYDEHLHPHGPRTKVRS